MLKKKNLTLENSKVGKKNLTLENCEVENNSNSGKLTLGEILHFLDLFPKVCFFRGALIVNRQFQI